MQLSGTYTVRRDEQLRDQALQIDKLAKWAGYPCTPLVTGTQGFSDHPFEIMMGEQGYLRQFEKISKPILESMVSTNYKLNPEKVAKSKIAWQR